MLSQSTLFIVCLVVLGCCDVHCLPPPLHDITEGRIGLNYSMVLVGGGLDDNNDQVWDNIIFLGGGKGVARFGVISAASEVY
jgi:hypothetical protein